MGWPPGNCARNPLWALAVGATCLVVALVADPLADAAVWPADQAIHTSKPQPVARCVLPRGWRVVATDAQAVVIRQLVKRTSPGTPAYFNWSWRYCLHNTGRFRSLFADKGRSSGDVVNIVRHRSVALSGVYLAYARTTALAGGRLGCDGSVMIYNLSTRAGKDVFDYHCFAAAIGPLWVNSLGLAAWRVTSQPIATYTPLEDLSCAALSLCVAIDQAGNVLTATRPTAGRGAWTFTKPSTHLLAISCPMIGFCLGGGLDSVVTSSNPTGGAATWTVTRLPGNIAFDDVSCASSTLCVALGYDVIATSTNPTGGAGAWTETMIRGRHSLLRISCPSSSLCAATDAYGIYTSTNPTGGSSAWKFAPGVAAGGIVSCPSVSLCVAVASYSGGSEIVTSSKPTGGPIAWKTTTFPGLTFQDVSCASASLCVVLGSDGIETSTNPTGGADAWKTGRIDGGGGVRVSCPSTALCVAVRGGRIAASTDPAAGTASWKAQLVDAPECAVTTPCAAQQIYAYDSQGTRQLDGTPPGSAHALNNLQLTGNQVTWTHNGAHRQAHLG